MLIKTKEFQAAANKILMAMDADKNAASLEIATKNDSLYLNVTNKEFYVSVLFTLTEPQETPFRAVVDASLFLSLISGLTSDNFELSIKDNYVTIKADASSYKLAMIYENDSLMSVPVISIAEKSVCMPIKNDILMSILNVNGKELQKVKNIDVNELQKLYYIDETGCFTFTTGACVNSFTLEKPIKLLLNDRIVKLFKLFKDDVVFSMGYDQRNDGTLVTKITFETADTYVAAIITNDDLLISKVQRPCEATRKAVANSYQYSVVLQVSMLSSAISRLMLFTKNSLEKANMSYIPATLTVSGSLVTLTDKFSNVESVGIMNENTNDDDYVMAINLADLKLVLDSCKTDYVTLNCGDHRAYVINRGSVCNLIPELVNE